MIKQAITALCIFAAIPAHAGDKERHAAAGAVVGVFGAAMSPERPWQGACIAAAAVGIAKEAYDATGRGNVEIADVLATMALPCIGALFEGPFDGRGFTFRF